jgi:hypothetical protein
MKTTASVREQPGREPAGSDRGAQGAAGADGEDELIMHLERDQFVAATSRPVPRAKLSHRSVLALWGLRVFAVMVSAMVVYTFIAQLR